MDPESLAEAANIAINDFVSKANAAKRRSMRSEDNNVDAVGHPSASDGSDADTHQEEEEQEWAAGKLETDESYCSLARFTARFTFVEIVIRGPCCFLLLVSPA